SGGAQPPPLLLSFRSVGSGRGLQRGRDRRNRERRLSGRDFAPDVGQAAIPPQLDVHEHRAPAHRNLAKTSVVEVSPSWLCDCAAAERDRLIEIRIGNGGSLGRKTEKSRRNRAGENKTAHFTLHETAGPTCTKPRGGDYDDRSTHDLGLDRSSYKSYI